MQNIIHKLMNPILKKALALAGQLLLIVSLVSCASTTTVQALNSAGEPDKDVKIYVDGEYKGDGRIQYTDSKPKSAFLNSTIVQLKKAGCQTKRDSLKIKMNIPKFIGSMVLAMGGGGLIGWWTEYPPFDSVIGTLALSGAVIIAVLIPSLWVNEYKPFYSYDFQCVKAD